MQSCVKSEQFMAGSKVCHQLCAGVFIHWAENMAEVSPMCGGFSAMMELILKDRNLWSSWAGTAHLYHPLTSGQLEEGQG